MCNMVLTYGGERHNLKGFTDADGALQDHCQAILGYAFIMDSGANVLELKKVGADDFVNSRSGICCTDACYKECI
jgi:hypothetical protein